MIAPILIYVYVHRNSESIPIIQSTTNATVGHTSEIFTTESYTTEEPTTEEPTTISQEQINQDKINKLLSEMTIEEKEGQMFYVRCPNEQAVEMISEYHLGGYILFGRDFEGKTKEEITSTIESGGKG